MTSADPYMECPIYVEHGACSCSTGVYGNTCALPGLGEPECEEHHIVLTPHIVTLGPDDEHALPEQLVCRLCFLEDAIYEQGHQMFALRADNHRIRAAIGRHRERIMSLGHDGKGKHGSEWDRDLWSVLYDFLRPEQGRDPYEGHRHERPCAWCHEPESLCRCDNKPEDPLGHVCNFDRVLFGGGVACTICDEVEGGEGCSQEFAGFGPPCSDPLCESCTATEKCDRLATPASTEVER